ncbi:hypothetical protein CIG75_00420 [Tumebacillus algifaecis]|uniref:DUF2306 domain-containing protein n=1 Tax=Tumebacillus algifaecis TaxID=1214604 RepID=A0A223CW80_9BACL|nr:DUF2306 domain-containing protein [Tumebacillus algifaecis]ASS73588.1 hypothetical protein CIG75_00420 [Tumebacillus algifaecis]
MRTKLLYVAILLFLLYTFIVYFLVDPHATEFLSHKDQLPRNVSAWLTVLQVHILFASLALVVGALNFSTIKRKSLHRALGMLYVFSVLVTVLTSGYMAPSATGGKASSMVFNLLELVWMALTVTAVVAIIRNRPNQHRKWMIRSYVICFTNFFIHLLAFLLQAGFGLEYPEAYKFSLYGSLVLMVVLSEVWIRRWARR